MRTIENVSEVLVEEEHVIVELPASGSGCGLVRLSSLAKKYDGTIWGK